MALSRSKSGHPFLALALTLAAAHRGVSAPAVAPAAAAPAVAGPARPALSLNPKEKIDVDAASSDVDYRTNTIVFKHIVVSQGATRVRADHARATGLNFDNSRWTFRGNVQIDAPPRGSLRSDQATVQFRDNRIAGVTITGNPAQFEQQRADALGTETGHADQIIYDVSQGTVLLTNDACISDGRNEMSAPSIAYSIREQKVLATSASASQGVHITITPQGVSKAAPPRGGTGSCGPPRASEAPSGGAHPSSHTGATAAPPPQAFPASQS